MNISQPILEALVCSSPRTGKTGTEKASISFQTLFQDEAAYYASHAPATFTYHVAARGITGTKLS